MRLSNYADYHRDYLLTIDNAKQVLDIAKQIGNTHLGPLVSKVIGHSYMMLGAFVQTTA